MFIVPYCYILALKIDVSSYELSEDELDFPGTPIVSNEDLSTVPLLDETDYFTDDKIRTTYSPTGEVKSYGIREVAELKAPSKHTDNHVSTSLAVFCNLPHNSGRVSPQKLHYLQF